MTQIDDADGLDSQNPATFGVSTRRGLLGIAASSVFVGTAVRAASVAPKAASVVPKGAEEVIVIGGGFCGVTAARELRHRGYRVTLLEARNRLGGRTFTSDFAGQQVDFGGTWIHWLQPHAWSEVRRYGVELGETLGAAADRMIYLDRAGKRHETTATEQWPRMEKAMSDLFDGGYPVMPRPAEPFADDKWIKADTKSLRDKINSTAMPEDVRLFLDAMTVTWGSAPGDQISWVDMLRWYALSGYNLTVTNDAVSRYHVAGGTKVLLDAIAADAAADVQLSAPVSSIRQSGDTVEVTTESGKKLRASAVVCAVPLNVLGDIEFSPTLSSTKAKVSKQHHAGQGTKVHILLDKAYDNFSGWGPGDEAPINFLLWEGVHEGKTHVIAFGPSAETLDVNDVDAVQAAVRAFLPDAKVSAAYGYEWNVDPYSKGTWGVSRPGQLSSAIGDLQSSSGRVFFANADWANGWRGFIDGAIEQGIVAARNVDALLGKQIHAKS